jgi:hypothetical protein
MRPWLYFPFVSLWMFLMCPIHHPQDVNGRTISDMRPTLIDFIKNLGIGYRSDHARVKWYLQFNHPTTEKHIDIYNDNLNRDLEYIKWKKISFIFIKSISVGRMSEIVRPFTSCGYLICFVSVWSFFLSNDIIHRLIVHFSNMLQKG